MLEPDWDLVDAKFNREAQVNDLVWVTKKTRGRFGKMSVAPPGGFGLVISSWMSSMGSHKLTFISDSLEEYSTTGTCVRVWGNVDDHPKWAENKLKWMDKTFVPMIVVREKATGRRATMPYVISRSGAAVLVTPVGTNSKVWLNRDKVHPDDWATMINSKSRCHSVRIPEWVAKKAGIL
jgi:hypothetical protein